MFDFVAAAYDRILAKLHHPDNADLKSTELAAVVEQEKEAHLGELATTDDGAKAADVPEPDSGPLAPTA